MDSMLAKSIAKSAPSGWAESPAAVRIVRAGFADASSPKSGCEGAGERRLSQRISGTPRCGATIIR
jgi:hypothetical protein